MKLRAAFLLLITAVVLSGCSIGGIGENNQSQNKPQNVATTVPAAPTNIPASEPVARVAAQVSPSVVQVNVRAIQQTPFGAQAQEGLGSGVIYRKDGYIITNNHVVQGAQQVNVAFADGSIERGQVVGTDPFTDLAVVKVNRDNLPAAKFGNSSNLIVGQLAVAIGSPSGLQSTVTSGVISGLNRQIPSQLTGGQQSPSLVDLIQTDAPISPGNSGGALADAAGEVIGINVAYLPPGQTGAENIGFAIPSNTATSVANQLIQNGKATHPYLGISLADLTPEIAQRFGIKVQSGAIVVQTDPNGPSAKAGIQPKDVITAIGSTKIRNSGDLLSALRQYKPGDTVSLTLIKGDKESKVDVKLGERSS